MCVEIVRVISTPNLSSLTQVSQMSDANLPFTRDHLTDGYIPNIFGPQNAASYLVRLFQVVAPLVRAVRHRGGAFYVFNRPSHNSPPAVSVNGQHAWLLDHAVRRGGSVVPQQLWSPQGQDDPRRYVDQERFRTPIFFANMDGSIGVPVMSAGAGYMRLLGTVLPPQLADKTTIRIRIGVCTRSFLACSPSFTVCIVVAGLCALRIPGPTEGADSCEESHCPREVRQASRNSCTTIFGGTFVPKWR